MNRTSGFTVAEVLVAVGIAGLLALTAAPKFSELSSQFKLSTAATEMGFEVVRARSQAVAGSQRVRFHLGTGSFWVEEQDDESDAWELAASERFLPGGVSGSGSGTIEFGPSGLATDDVDLVITSATGTKTIHVSILGKIEVR